MPSAISLFSGIGGLDLAAALAGFDIRAQVEIDPFCRGVLRRHASTYWPLTLPLCKRCGCSHDRRTLSGDFKDYCQRCDDERDVESLQRWIFKVKPDLGQDDEAALDFLYQSAGHRELFERGVLPDYWYALKAGA